MTTKSDVLKAARDVESLNTILQGAAMTNAYSGTAEERLERAAEFRILRDRAQNAREAYDRAFRHWELSGFPEDAPPLNRSQ